MGSVSHHVVTALFLFAFLWPLINGLILLNTRWCHFCLKFTPYAALPALTLSMLAIQNKGLESFAVTGWLLETVVGLPPTHALFLMFTAVIWLFAGLQSARSIDLRKQQRFFIFFLLAMAGNIRLCIAQDVIGFYSGYAVMSFASFGLILFRKTPSNRWAATLYIIYMFASELLLFSALAMVMQANGNLEFATVKASLAQDENLPALILLIAAFGIKSGLLGFHCWMPPSYRAAPPPAAAVLSGAMVKAGILGWLNMLPFGLQAFPSVGKVVMLIGLLGCFYAAALGVLQTNPKKLLAYSSISQMGLFVLAVGVAFQLPNQWLAILPMITGLALHHSLSKASLFMGTDFLTARWRCQNWWSWLVFFAISLALAGFLLSSGMVAKSLLKEQLHYLPTRLEHFYVHALSWASCATAVLMARFQYLIRPQCNLANPAKASAAPSLGYWWSLALLSQVLPWLLFRDQIKLELPELFNSFWPVALAVCVAFMAYKINVSVRFVSGFNHIQRLWRRSMIRTVRRIQGSAKDLFLFEFSIAIVPAFVWRRTMNFTGRILVGAENQLSLWSVAISAALLIGLLLALVLLLG